MQTTYKDIPERETQFCKTNVQTGAFTLEMRLETGSNINRSDEQRPTNARVLKGKTSCFSYRKSVSPNLTVSPKEIIFI